MPRGDLGATVPARRTLTDHEDRTIGRLADALDKQETVFSFGGLAECSADCLVYRAASDEVRFVGEPNSEGLESEVLAPTLSLFLCMQDPRLRKRIVHCSCLRDS